MIHPRHVACALLAFLAPLASRATAGPAGAKDKAAAPPKTGLFQLECAPHYPYVAMAVPKDYDPSTYYPLFFLLPPVSDNAEASKPDAWVKPWADVMLKKGWIVASPADGVLDNETSLPKLQGALKKVTTTYRIDDRRVLVGGYAAGGLMAWRMAVKFPALWAGIVTIAAEVHQGDRGSLKAFAGKPAYVFRGERDPYYSASALKSDRASIEFAKIKLTVEEKPGWKNDFPTGSVETIVKWMDDVWPAGAYREKSLAVAKAIAEKDLAPGFAALKDMKDDLKKNPYPAFESRAAALEKSLLELGRAPFEEARKILETNPIGALEQTEAAAKAMKGNPFLEKEAVAALAAIRKDPRVVEALKSRDAEAASKKLLEKAEEAEGKGELAKALELFRKIVALGETSIKVDCEQKVAELEKKTAGK